jgi:hypothetical protein
MATLQRISPPVKRPLLLSPTQWWSHLVWVLVIALVSMAIPAFFASVLQLPRNVYLIPYVLFITAFLYGYVRWGNVDLWAHLRKNWAWGVGMGLVLSVYTVQTVLMQPRSPMPQGAELIFNLAWLGVIYGATDALLLSVFPVYAMWQACTLLGWTTHWRGRIGSGVLALLASMLVIGLYHIGYPEYRNSYVLLIIAGVALQSLAYIATRSPLAPVIGHIAMHVAAVLYGIQSASQLPPHY